MLVLSRKLSQSIIISENIRVTVVSIRGNQVRLGIEAPSSVKVYREELCYADRHLDRSRYAQTERRSRTAGYPMGETIECDAGEVGNRA